jgi:hypothetical protein
VPEVYPAQVANDVCPVTINYGDYFMSGSIWRKFNAKFFDVSFGAFMSRKIEKYEQKNLDAKNVFEHYRNCYCRGGAYRRRIHGSKPCSVVPAREDASSSSSPLVLPKIEVIDLTEDAEYEYMYKSPR